VYPTHGAAGTLDPLSAAPARDLGQSSDASRLVGQPGGGPALPGGQGRALGQPGGGADRAADQSGGGPVRATDQPGGGGEGRPGGGSLVTRSADPSSIDKRSEMSGDDTNSSLHEIQPAEDETKKFVNSGNGTR
jgi:hypothetical protein